MSESRPTKKQAKSAPTSVRRPVAPSKAKIDDVSPSWWAPMMVTLMVLGCLWVVVYYASLGKFPVQAWGNWNLAAGGGLLMVGFLMTTNWR
ncbi:Uncharacterised protein family (UPF0233) [Austwickia chelonae]|uniref:Cell division protein CrgA n=1 Tax=Austwickia chelonae NBRC 105200 TaxID=1184607 RepID=K6WB88_9MICO|nr:cell division protein CrgA [Austwickia chelonae]GAB79087.1 hypothetical protein AUCHE_18_00880 [Austwickia chelonae NBRC 105200]SEW42163.1 Uncharacterised protein family (UPF0233) [Austwickia chelonae]